MRVPVAGLRFLAARAVGHGQQGGNRQHQPVAAHTRPKGPLDQGDCILIFLEFRLSQRC